MVRRAVRRVVARMAAAHRVVVDIAAAVAAALVGTVAERRATALVHSLAVDWLVDRWPVWGQSVRLRAIVRAAVARMATARTAVARMATARAAVVRRTIVVGRAVLVVQVVARWVAGCPACSSVLALHWRVSSPTSSRSTLVSWDSDHVSTSLSSRMGRPVGRFRRYNTS